MSFYRFLEIFPAVLSWGTLALFVALSFIHPAFVGIFIILFDIYWLLKTIYFSLHLKNSFSKMKKNLSIDWRDKLKKEYPRSWEDIFHLVILPMYHEPYEVVRESVLFLKKSNYPKEKFIVVLATEERAGDSAQETAEKITKEFSKDFFRLFVTCHPKDIPGELPGKGSNQAWAGKQVKKEIIDPLAIPYEKIITSVFDVDTQVYPEYFGVLTHAFLSAEKPLLSSYQPVPLFLNNFKQAPAFSRIVGFSATFWNMMQQGIPEKLVTFSSHSMPFKALVDIGFWHTHMVSEDSRIFFQCFTEHRGDWRTVPLFYPVSMDANAAPTLFQTLKNIYWQQRRWAWGVENIAYLLSEFKKQKEIPKTKKLLWTFFIVETFHSWATNAILIFSLGWLPLLVGGEQFLSTILAHHLPEVTHWVMTVSSVGIVTSAVFSMMLIPRKLRGGKRQAVFYLLSWLLMPFSLIFFSSLPALEAQTRLALSGKFRLDFWVTPKHR